MTLTALPHVRLVRPAALAAPTLGAAVFASLVWLRVHDIDRHFWMLGDQIRDWSIALGPFRDLPLVGPATHVGGYTIGPAFYWLLWLIRVTFGPWFDNLPHAGGIGQAAFQSAADVLLLWAIWRRTGSVWIALASTILIATAAYDLCLSASVWNPTMGSTLVKIATALVLLDWWRSWQGTTVAAAVAWSAVHAYTGAIFATLGVFAATVMAPLVQHRRTHALRNASIIVGVVLLMQVPLALHQLTRSSDSAMGAVTGSLARIARGDAEPQLAASWRGLTGAFLFIQGAPWQHAWQVWLLIACAGLVAVRFRRDVPVLATTLLPLILALAGYALYVGDFLDTYYYLSLMPAAVLTVVLGLTAVPRTRLSSATAVLLVAAALMLVPGRARFARGMHRLPEYGILLDGSRDLASRGHAVRRIIPLFPLPPTADPHFLFTILGGRIDAGARWTAVITSSGRTAYRELPQERSDGGAAARELTVRDRP